MALDGCGQLCKCILILFNILFALVGFAMLGLGLWLRFSSETRGFFNVDLNTQQFVIGVSVLIALGAVILLVAVFGDYGACNENRTALGVFSCLLAILAVLEIGAGVFAYMRSDEVGEQLAKFYITVYAQYVNKGDPGLAVTLSMFHNALHCCGIIGALDLLVKKTCPDTGFLETFTLPACPTVIVNLFESKAPLVMGLFLGTAAMLIMGLVCCSILMKQIKMSHLSAPCTTARPCTEGTGPPPYSNTVFSSWRPNQIVVIQ
ncbi:CD9 antigen isoform X2 [Salvelinus sp. IW2-2015]|uniref:CD9 antigen isoform X2 n=1 Tax=Salvelinus sp. IW2-2015 TaxID=2691554 RepID=UPI000CEB1DF7|nr:CD9 antigen-like isoform X2 [Salvelinus alpinus]